MTILDLRPLVLPLALLATALPASAQVVLPKKKQPAQEKKTENSAERLLRQGQAPETDDPVLSRRTGIPGEARRQSRERQRGGILDLPSRSRVRRALEEEAGGDAQPSQPALGPVLPPPTQPEVVPSGVPAGGAVGDPMVRSAAALVLEQLRQVRAVDAPELDGIVERLVALGEEGLIVARVGLASEEAAEIVASGRVLLHSSNPLDPPRVEGLLELPLPREAAAPLLAAFVEQAPVRATPAFLARQLCHSQAPMRHAAQGHLRGMLTEENVAVLDVALQHDRSDARFRAVELLGGFEGPETVSRLLDRIDDGTPKVARLAIDALAPLEDPIIDHELLEQTFAERWILTSSAYAILAIMEREDELLRPILDGRHVDALMRGMASSDPFVRGSCTAALAGIGFRSEDPTSTTWLDREVPDALVSVVASREFFPELSSLRDSATRRLTLIAGVSYGADAPAWARWWLDNREDFRASRAVLRVSPGDASGLQMLVQPGDRIDGSPVPPYQLIGPDVDHSSVVSHEGEAIYLTEAEAENLLGIARDEGLLDTRRLPGVRGGTLIGARAVELRVAQQAKSFHFAPDASQAWFERIVSACNALAERNRWQRFPTPQVYPTRHSLWEDQHVWWATQQDVTLRLERLESLCMAYAERRPAGGRDLAFRELARLWQQPELRDVEDSRRLLSLIEREPYYGEEARTLANLIVQASGFGSDADPAEAPPVGDPRRGSMERLIFVLEDRFSSASAEELVRILTAMGPERVRGAASDKRSLLRALAAGLLAGIIERGEEALPEDTQLLLELIDDPDLDVRVAAVMAAGNARVEAARGRLLALQLDSPRELRLVSLPAIGRLGGEGARDALVRAMGEPEEEVKAAAAEGLAELKDPSTAHLLVSQLMRRGGDSAAFPKVREALLGMGRDVIPELMTTLRSSSQVAQRQSALLLAELGEAVAAQPLLRFVTIDPTDSVALEELVILSCVDNRREIDPAGAWYRWWDSVRHNDAFLWYLTAMELRDLPAPPRGEFQSGGSAEAVAFLLQGMNREEPWLAERSRRELERMTGTSIERALPERGPARDAYLETLYEVLGETRQ